MESNRRQFLKIAGISAMGLGATAPLHKVFAEDIKAPQPATKKHGKNLEAGHWAMVIDTRRLTSRELLVSVMEACHSVHNVPTQIENKNHEIKWIWETEYAHAFPEMDNAYLNDSIKKRPFLVLCNHCENPPCTKACPTKATFKRESDGIVMMDYHRCIGCRFCMAACPYGARSFNFRDPRPFIKEVNLQFPTRMKGVVEKCNFCAERLAVGKMPACVEVSNGAIAFGDLSDPNSTVRFLLKDNYTIRRKQGLGTQPSVYYIV